MRPLRQTRDLLLHPIGAVRLACRLGCLSPEDGAARYVVVVATYFRKTGELPTIMQELRAEVMAAAGPLPEGAGRLPDIGLNGPPAPEWAWYCFHTARGTEGNAGVLSARLALAAAGFIPDAALFAPGGFSPLLEPALDLRENPGRDAETFR